MITGIVASERQHTGKPIRMSGSGRRVRRIGYQGSTLTRHATMRTTDQQADTLQSTGPLKPKLKPDRHLGCASERLSYTMLR